LINALTVREITALPLLSARSESLQRTERILVDFELMDVWNAAPKLVNHQIVFNYDHGIELRSGKVDLALEIEKIKIRS